MAITYIKSAMFWYSHDITTLERKYRMKSDEEKKRIILGKIKNKLETMLELVNNHLKQNSNEKDN